ncbi:MAG TPA: nucleotidyltransferase family protein [Usitatibacter sp.]|nr:nucleotidyltransferase family protein [Usitatibacter sp.]
MDIRGLLLCGGRAARFGSDKLLAVVPGQEPAGPIAARAARSLLEGAGNAHAIVPTGASSLRSVLEEAGCAVLESDRTSEGMGASLAALVAANERADGWIVALGDMPLANPATIAAVRRALEEGALLAAPVSAETGARGHPVGFAAPLRAELLALAGDAGARSVVERHRGSLQALPTDDPGIFLDLDTPAQLEALREAGSQRISGAAAKR